MVQPGFRRWDRQRSEAQPFRSEFDGGHSKEFNSFKKFKSLKSFERLKRLERFEPRLAAPGLHLASGIFGLTAESGYNHSWKRSRGSPSLLNLLFRST